MEIPHLPESGNTEQKRKKIKKFPDFAHVSHAQRRLEVPVGDITIFCDFITHERRLITRPGFSLSRSAWHADGDGTSPGRVINRGSCVIKPQKMVMSPILHQRPKSREHGLFSSFLPLFCISQLERAREHQPGTSDSAGKSLFASAVRYLGISPTCCNQHEFPE